MNGRESCILRGSCRYRLCGRRPITQSCRSARRPAPFAPTATRIPLDLAGAPADGLAQSRLGFAAVNGAGGRFARRGPSDILDERPLRGPALSRLDHTADEWHQPASDLSGVGDLLFIEH
jgi:hypothetical protein